MCDCYEHKCELCDNMIALHIADFCVPRKKVHVYCPFCIKRVSDWNDVTEVEAELSYRGFGAKRVFFDVVENPSQVFNTDGKAIGRKGQVVLITCDDAKAKGIHLN